MNKVLQQLYLSLSEDDAFYSAETEQAFSNIYNTVTADMSLKEENKIYDMLGDYSYSVKANAFEVGFRTAVQLLMGAGQE